ncbi:type II toxin-antitoxin system RelE/ParE family toxin [Kocuria sp. ZOR0020]|uniref:type II toxin-antitoxin system RelE/ParE family toxin n=1 Tax=Kocuria sp. ZOR0020 TaxID=1339234 RepID=UPI00064924A6|nr:type II toxin-antitoxin system RelE/ParE family toxin [Kocuria sp. ZOR0020]
MADQVKRQWRWYSPRNEGQPVAKRELLDLPKHGQGALIAAMKRYSTGSERSGEVKPIEDHLMELRTQVGNDPFRLIFFRDTPVHAIALHVFYKNQKKLPRQNKKIAKDRLKTWRQAHRDDVDTRD